MPRRGLAGLAGAVWGLFTLACGGPSGADLARTAAKVDAAPGHPDARLGAARADLGDLEPTVVTRTTGREARLRGWAARRSLWVGPVEFPLVTLYFDRDDRLRFVEIVASPVADEAACVGAAEALEADLGPPVREWNPGPSTRVWSGTTATVRWEYMPAINSPNPACSVTWEDHRVGPEASVGL